MSIYFPEYKSVFKNIEAPGSLLVLEGACLPADVLTMGENAINALWREAKLKAVGIKNATRLVDAAKTALVRLAGPRSPECSCSCFCRNIRISRR